MLFTTARFFNEEVSAFKSEFSSLFQRIGSNRLYGDITDLKVIPVKVCNSGTVSIDDRFSRIFSPVPREEIS